MARTYNPKKVSISLGNHTVTGFLKGTFLTISRNSDAFSVEPGSDGEVARVASADESGTYVLAVMQTSATNDFLSDKLAADIASNVDTFPVLVKDLSGSTISQAAEAWVKKAADVVFSDGIEGREWTIETGKQVTKVGSNTP